MNKCFLNLAVNVFSLVFKKAALMFLNFLNTSGHCNVIT